jgi:hypothetical protein
MKLARGKSVDPAAVAVVAPDDLVDSMEEAEAAVDDTRF